MARESSPLYHAEAIITMPCHLHHIQYILIIIQAVSAVNLESLALPHVSLSISTCFYSWPCL